MKIRCMVLVLLAAFVCLGGCGTGTSLRDAHDAYRQRQYNQAYRVSSEIARGAADADRYEAAYLAGLSAYRLNLPTIARRYLDIARQSRDPQTAGGALATAGLVHIRMGRYGPASRALTEATRHLTGEDRGKAYFFAARAEHKLGHWSIARTYLDLAETLTKNPVLRQRIAQEKALIDRASGR